MGRETKRFSEMLALWKVHREGQASPAEVASTLGELGIARSTAYAALNSLSEQGLVVETRTTTPGGAPRISYTPYSRGRTAAPAAARPAERPQESVTTPKRLYCALVLDESGSMSGLRQATIDGANAWLADQRKDGPEDLLTLVTFDAPQDPTKPRVRTLYDGVPLKEVVDLTSANYNPDGGTPLFDALGATISRIETDPRAADRSVVVVVMTDGLENASVEYTHEAIAAKIEQKERDGWTIMYLGANQDAKQVARAMRFDANLAVTYAPSPAGTEVMYEASSASISALRSGLTRRAVSEKLHDASATGETPR